MTNRELATVIIKTLIPDADIVFYNEELNIINEILNQVEQRGRESQNERLKTIHAMIDRQANDNNLWLADMDGLLAARALFELRQLHKIIEGKS